MTKKIAILGAGTMGQGIAQTAAAQGFTVVIRDISATVLERGINAISKNLDRLVAKQKLSADAKTEQLARIHTTTELAPLTDAVVVIEAATENPDLKLKIFKELHAACQPDTILASNTSSISLTEIAAASGRPDNVIGMHFFNPVPVMQLVEIIRALQTSDATFATIRTLTEQLGKTPVSVQDSPGFVVNRMLVPMINEAVFVLAEGVASAEEIDTAMKLGANHPIGPLALADLIGIDVCLYVMDVLYTQFNDSKYRACPLMRKMVAAGYLGRKSGKGFFDYSK